MPQEGPKTKLGVRPISETPFPPTQPVPPAPARRPHAPRVVGGEPLPAVPAPAAAAE